MKLQKFLKKHPECIDYKVTVWYSFYRDEEDLDVIKYAYLRPDSILTGTDMVVRVVAVDHENERVYMVKGNV